jgi:hypothetical protein
MPPQQQVPLLAQRSPQAALQVHRRWSRSLRARRRTALRGLSKDRKE